jgi:SPP1 family predicted phage head-tail adaptor
VSAENIAGLRARVTLLRPEPTGDDIGGQVVEFVSAGEAWARISASGASGIAVYDGAGARTGYRVEIRMRRDVKPTWRVEWGERALRINSISDADAAGAFLVLNCEEEML